MAKGLLAIMVGPKGKDSSSKAGAKDEEDPHAEYKQEFVDAMKDADYESAFDALMACIKE